MSEPMHADQIARKDFSQSFRGFDQTEVRAYLGQVAGELMMWRERVEQLQARIAELESIPPAELEEEALEIALGREATRVLHAAREAAADIRTRAETESAAKLAEAEARLAASADEAEAAAERARTDAERRAGSIVEAATAERERVLADLAARRRALELDIDALASARDALTEAFAAARTALDHAESGVRDAGDAATAAVTAPPSPVVDEPAPAAVEPEPEPETEPEPEPVAVEPEAEPEPTPAEDRRSSSLKLVRPLEEGRGTPVAPPVQDSFEGVRIIRPEPPASPPEPVDAEPEPEPEPESIAEPEPVAEPEAAAEEPVEDLFARLRADRAEKVAKAEAVLATPAPAEDDAPAPAETIEEPPAPTGDVGPDLAVLAARDERLADDERALVRALKRALADEQNEVLDALRRLRGAPTVAALLPERAAHDARFESVLAGGVATAAGAGGEAADGDGGTAPKVAAELGRSVVTDVRARVERAIEEASGDVETLAEAISSAYREWKTARAEPLARDAITAGFAAGMYAASSGTLRWVVDPAEGGCPDCDDNVLAGATAKGAAYPTGQLHPPAHAGCRCVVVTAS